MLERMVRDRAHALRDRLILQVDAVYPAIDRVAALGGTVHTPIVARVGGKPKAPEPIGAVRQKLVAASGAADRPAILEGRLRLRQCRYAALPAQEAEHGVAVIERDPAARMHVTAELAVGGLAPERKQEVGEPTVAAVRARGAVDGVLRAPGGIGDMILRGAVGDGVVNRIILVEIVRIDVAGVQETEMRSIDLALERLQIIAFALDERDED